MQLVLAAAISVAVVKAVDVDRYTRPVAVWSSLGASENGFPKQEGTAVMGPFRLVVGAEPGRCRIKPSGGRRNSRCAYTRTRLA